jgi:hypothetical protein
MAGHNGTAPDTDEDRSKPAGSAGQRRIISDDDIHQAIDWLTNKAPRQIADATERATRASHMVKHIKALQMMASDASSVAKAEMEAYASEAYVEAITEDAIAAGELRKLLSLRQAAELRIEIWRSQGATLRATRI